MYRKINQEDQNRLVEIYRNGVWSDKRSFADLQVGDRFRLYEADGTLVKDSDDGAYEFRAISDVYTHSEYNVMTIDTVPILRGQFKEE